MWNRGRVLVVVMAALPLVACAARSRAVTAEARPPSSKTVDNPRAESPGTLSAYIERVLALSTRAKPLSRYGATVTAESWDARLAAALLAATVSPGPDREEAVAVEYRRLKILDRALLHYSRAVAMDATDSGAYEGRARIWRDWGFPNLALADAHRAVYYSPGSASAQNTLGTVLLGLDHRSEAAARFEKAAGLDPDAWYALNNLCYVNLVNGQVERAEALCRQALAILPSQALIHNNLGLVYASQGNFVAAAAEFGTAGDAGAAQFNLGIANLATGQFGPAATAFEAAGRLRPGFEMAQKRAAQARRLAAEVLDQGDPR